MYRRESENITVKYGIVAAAEAEQTGVIIDRLGYGSGRFFIHYTGSLADEETVTATVKIQDGNESDLSDAVTATLQNGVVVHTDVGGGTRTLTSELDLDLEGYGRYIRFQVTLATSAGTDNLTYCAGIALADARTKPVAATF